MTEQVHLRILFNPKSGSRQAESLAAQVIPSLKKSHPIHGNLIYASVDKWLPPPEEPTLTLLFGGDGSFFRKLKNSNAIDFIIPMGGGGENAVARSLNTLNTSPEKILKNIFSRPRLCDSFRQVSPWQAENLSSHETINFFWLFGVGGSLLARTLQAIEDHRDEPFQSYYVRLIRAYLDVLAKPEQYYSQAIIENQASPPGLETLIATGLIPVLGRFPLAYADAQIIHFPRNYLYQPISPLAATTLAFTDVSRGLISPLYLRCHRIDSHQVFLTHRGLLNVDSEVYSVEANQKYQIHRPGPTSPTVWFPKPIQD